MKRSILLGLLIGVVLLALLLMRAYFYMPHTLSEVWLALACLGLLLTGYFGAKRFQPEAPTNARLEWPEEIALTKREGEILPLLLNGLSNREIAEKLYVSESTVKTHVGNILSKCALKNRTQLLAKYGAMPHSVPKSSEIHT